MISRRNMLMAIAALGSGALASPLRAYAQAKSRLVRIGRLSPLSQTTDRRSRESFITGLREFGWIEGNNCVVEHRFADGRGDRYAALAEELVRIQPEVIVVGSTPASLAVKQATASIPIVMVTTGDPVVNGLVKSLARPGRNITGLTSLAQELGAKRLELFAEVVPGIRQMAVLVNHSSPDTKPSLDGVQKAAKSLGIALSVHEARDVQGIEKAFAAMEQQHAKALMVLQHPMFVTQQEMIVKRAARAGVPAMYAVHEFVESGGLIYYGVDLADLHRRAATYVDKILRGAKPAELPVEQPTKFELVVNMKTAKELNIRFPQSVLVRADKVIE